jgi:O-acetyl-ADP-ribose deacetylase (regulator of RNase III)
VIQQGRGNMLTADVDALVNTVNTVGVMGKGIALQFRRAFPANYKAYQKACARGEVTLGRIYVFDTEQLMSRRYILNFPTKKHWRSKSRLTDIQTGLDDLVRVVTEFGIESIAIPALGCGNGGLDWAVVRPLIERACARLPQVRWVIFPPSGAPSAAEMPNATRQPELTPLRALLVMAIARYHEHARLQQVSDGVSELEIQKLAYFLQVVGAALPLSFTKGRYGPYDERLPYVLDALEGHYLVGFGDRSAHVTDLVPIKPLGDAIEIAAAGLKQTPEDYHRLEDVLRLIDGFETPYSLELLATVHFAAMQEPQSGDPDVLSTRVSEWNLRKARLFSAQHVRIAAERLAERGLLPA